MFNLNNANMENLITQINKERLVNSDTALMMKELYYYVPCEYWYDKQDRLRTDIEGRNTPMYMCECPTLAACIQWMIQTREYTFYQPVFYFSQRFLADAENGDTAYHFKVHTVAQVVAHIGHTVEMYQVVFAIINDRHDTFA